MGIASVFMAAFKPYNLPLLFTAELLNSDDDNMALQICELVSVSSRGFFEQPLKNPVTSTSQIRRNANNFL